MRNPSCRPRLSSGCLHLWPFSPRSENAGQDRMPRNRCSEEETLQSAEPFACHPCIGPSSTSRRLRRRDLGWNNEKDDAMDQDHSLVALRLDTNVRVHHDATKKGSWNRQKLCLLGRRIHGGLACRTDARSENSKSGQVLVRSRRVLGYHLLTGSGGMSGVLKLPKRAAAASSPKRIKRTQKPRPLAVGVFIFVSTPASSIDAPVTFPLIFLLTPARAGRTIRLVSPKSSSLQPECTPLEASVYSALIWQPRKTES